MLLSGLGIADDVFLSRFKNYYNELEQLHSNHDIAFIYLLKYDNVLLSEQIIRDPASLREPKVQAVLKEIRGRELEKLPKLSIMIPKSRNVFGICDPSGTLEYGECFFRPTIDGRPKTLTVGRVVVAKNPCYHLGDIR